MTDPRAGTRPATSPAVRIPDRSQEFEFRAGAGSLSRAAAGRDVHTRRWGVVSPAATTIGRAESEAADLPEDVRALHDERHGAMAGHGERMHRLDRLRITQALCNQLSVTPWQRDRALGIMRDVDLTAFGSQRAVEKVALVAIRHVVDDDRKRYLGLHDREWLRERSPEELEALSEGFQSIKDERAFEALLDRHGLDKTSLNRLQRVLREEVDAQGLAGAVLGRNPYRDTNLPDVRARDRSDGDGRGQAPDDGSRPDGDGDGRSGWGGNGRTDGQERSRYDGDGSGRTGGDGE